MKSSAGVPGVVSLQQRKRRWRQYRKSFEAAPTTTYKRKLLLAVSSAKRPPLGFIPLGISIAPHPYTGFE